MLHSYIFFPVPCEQLLSPTPNEKETIGVRETNCSEGTFQWSLLERLKISRQHDTCNSIQISYNNILVLCLFLFHFKIFPGNNDQNTVVKNYLRHNITALLIRFFPETYFTYPAMRVEVYGGKGTYIAYDCENSTFLLAV